jgi:hypothetical protein
MGVIESTMPATRSSPILRDLGTGEDFDDAKAGVISAELTEEPRNKKRHATVTRTREFGMFDVPADCNFVASAVRFASSRKIYPHF